MIARQLNRDLHRGAGAQAAAKVCSGGPGLGTDTTRLEQLCSLRMSEAATTHPRKRFMWPRRTMPPMPRAFMLLTPLTTPMPSTTLGIAPRTLQGLTGGTGITIMDGERNNRANTLSPSRAPSRDRADHEEAPPQPARERLRAAGPDSMS